MKRRILAALGALTITLGCGFLAGCTETVISRQGIGADKAHPTTEEPAPRTFSEVFFPKDDK